MVPADDGWEGLLDPGEEVLWQGQPEPGVRLEWDSPFEPLFMMIFIGLSVFWMARASAAGGLFWMFGLPFFLAGFYPLALRHFWMAYVRRSTTYTITSKRAIIGTVLFRRRKLKSYPILPQTGLEYGEKAGLSDIYFGHDEFRDDGESTYRKVGFVRLQDGKNVLSIMRQAQEQRTGST